MNHRSFHSGFASLPQKAKNAFNQPALDKLRTMSQEPRYTDHTHYPRVFRQGMASLGKATEEIRTVDDALALKNVGPFLAKIIAGAARKEAGGGVEDDGGGDNGDSNDGNKKKTAGRKRKAAPAAAASFSSSSSGSKAPTPGAGQKQLRIVPPAAAGPMAKRARPRKAANNNTSSSSSTSTADPAKPSAKQTAYARAVREGEGLSATLDQYGDWRVILLVDRRERKADHVQAKLLMSGIEAEIRQLPIGDMLWIARGVRKRITPGSGLGLGGAAERQQVEVVLGTVVERKTLEDLASSLFGTRFEEQRLRLKNSAAGANQVLYLVEAETVNDLPNCSGATLRYAMMQTQVHLGFACVRTKSLDDTVRYLKRVHRRLMRRSFPSEFRSIDFESGTGRAIPTFTSPDGGVRRNDQAAAGGGGAAAASEDLVFQNPPVPFEARRHTIYEEFKAKLELARESGTKSVKALHCAMLKQVDSWAIAKVHGLTALYETPASLARAYRDALARGGLDEADSMVQDVRIGKSAVRARRVGPKSSTELAKVYTAGVNEEELFGDENYALKEGDEELPLQSSPTKAGVAAAAAAAAPAKCTYGEGADLSSDDDNDEYERTPRRRNNGKGAAPENKGGESDDDLNRKPPALSREELAAVREGRPVNERSSSAIQYDYELSSDSDESDALPGNGVPEQKRAQTNAVSSKSKTNSNCYDLTLDSSDDDEDDKATEGAILPTVTDTSNDGVSANRGHTASNVTSNLTSNVQDQRPCLSHDGIGDSGSESKESNTEASDDSDSESSCDELVVRLRKRAIENGEKARLYDTSSTSRNPNHAIENGRGQHFFPSGNSDSSPEQPSCQQERSIQQQAEAGGDSSSDVEVIELLD